MLGLVAGAMTTGSIIPQVLKIIRSKTSRDISTMFFLFMSGGMLLWLVYGILRADPVIVIWNSISLSLSLAILALKKIYP
ncbi:MAG: MtN3/saliva family protein [Methanocella sp. PtaU1.Bin125]|nr:MAG: MtN3/saliva family protein [Methanocella sp. PtaU1.Bin125]